MGWEHEDLCELLLTVPLAHQNPVVTEVGALHVPVLATTATGAQKPQVPVAWTVVFVVVSVAPTIGVEGIAATVHQFIILPVGAIIFNLS